MLGQLNKSLHFFVNKYHSRNLVAASDVTKKTSLSLCYISKKLPYLTITNTNTKLPRVLCIDDFKGNSSKFKYQVALIDGETLDIIDILECRHKHILCGYFKRFPKEQIDKLEYILINYSENLRIVYREKECLLDILHSSESSEIHKQQFNKWVKRNLESNIPQLCQYTKTYQHWSIEIRNSLEVPYSNGITGGFNNKIKTLKRVCFEMKNFKNFKARIMLLNRG